MSNDEYQRKVTVGQAMNMAHSYMLKFDIPTDIYTGKAMVTMDGYKKLLEQRTQEFKAMIESIQESYKNVVGALQPLTGVPQGVVGVIPAQPVVTQPTPMLKAPEQTQTYNFKK